MVGGAKASSFCWCVSSICYGQSNNLIILNMFLFKSFNLPWWFERLGVINLLGIPQCMAWVMWRYGSGWISWWGDWSSRVLLTLNSAPMLCSSRQAGQLQLSFCYQSNVFYLKKKSKEKKQYTVGGCNGWFCFVCEQWAIIASRINIILGLALDFYSVQQSLSSGGTVSAIKARFEKEVDRIDKQFDDCMAFLLRVSTFLLLVDNMCILGTNIIMINYTFTFFTCRFYLLSLMWASFHIWQI